MGDKNNITLKSYPKELSLLDQDKKQKNDRERCHFTDLAYLQNASFEPLIHSAAANKDETDDGKRAHTHTHNSCLNCILIRYRSTLHSLRSAPTVTIYICDLLFCIIVHARLFRIIKSNLVLSFALSFPISNVDHVISYGCRRFSTRAEASSSRQ